MFVGVGASRVRDMFEQGKKHSLYNFIDEIDAVGRSRGAGLGVEMMKENKLLTNCLLRWMALIQMRVLY